MRKQDKVKLTLEADYVITGDWHLRDTTPPCRTGDFIQIQERKIVQIIEFAQSVNAIIIHTGDFFDRQKPSHYTLDWIIQLLKKYKPTIYAIPGNHDQKSSDSMGTGFGILLSSGLIQPISKNTLDSGKIMAIHKLVFPPKQRPAHWATEDCCCNLFRNSVLKENPKVQVIATGDNHQSFLYKNVLNPGCMTRQTTHELEYKCGFFSIIENSISFNLLEMDDSTVDWDYINQKNREKSKVDSLLNFIDSMKTNNLTNLSFLQNVEAYMEANKIPSEIRDIIYQCIEEE